MTLLHAPRLRPVLVACALATLLVPGSAPGGSATHAPPSAVHASIGDATPRVVRAPASPGADGTWAPLVVPMRRGAAAVFDPVHERMIVFGGYDDWDARDYLGDVWVYDLAGASGWTRMLAAGTPPSARQCASAVYDPARDRVVVFGGDDGLSYANDTWALTLSGTPEWSELAPTGTPPGGRYQCGAVVDAARDRMLVFGGYDGECTNDLWALSLGESPAWTQVAVTGLLPAARHGHGLVLDASRDRLVLVGGCAGTTELSDVWTLDLSGPAEWSEVAPSGAAPHGRQAAAVVGDPERDRVVVFGGTYADVTDQYLSDAWSLDLAGAMAWSELPAVGPQPRAYGGAVLDAPRARMVTWGGTPVCDGWALSLAGTPAWTPLVSAAPARRQFACSAYDAARDRVVVFGGMGEGCLGDAWTLALGDAPAWWPIAPAGTPPAARAYACAVTDPVRDRLLVFGGWNPDGLLLADVWALSLGASPAWTPLAPAGEPPPGRAFASAVYDAAHDRVLVFGGRGRAIDAGEELSDVWALTLSGAPAWAKLEPSGTPPAARERHGAVVDGAGGRMLVFGGNLCPDRCCTVNDVWALSLGASPAWTELAPSGTAPDARCGQVTALDASRARMVVFGGEGESPGNDAWALALEGPPAWTALAPEGAPPAARAGAAAVVDPVHDRLVVIGGACGEGVALGDAWALRWSGASAVPPVPAAASALFAPAPNPARGEATVRFVLARAGHARLDLHDVAGRHVRTLLDGVRPAGESRAGWDGLDANGARAGAGVYFLRLTAPDRTVTRRVVRLE